MAFRSSLNRRGDSTPLTPFVKNINGSVSLSPGQERALIKIIGAGKVGGFSVYIGDAPTQLYRFYIWIDGAKHYLSSPRFPEDVMGNRRLWESTTSVYQTYGTSEEIEYRTITLNADIYFNEIFELAFDNHARDTYGMRWEGHISGGLL
ncbi:hypothetical protein E8L90_29650 [Brevibacillus antibioticus]|uniref:Uncharacterized protein n=1 Tax=Brevibacillus antibioticus TaxID=2570228 RepID=A0A4U2Y0D5_9BACL|nr:hypothetical protein [Brevibacillus antibioticus]TKI52922.1 hypothetical protein E8L90_29650 [Brevibacillus antibioticus]